MSRKTISYDYRCFNDCQQTGCPGHSMTLTYEGSSDTIALTTLGHKDAHGEWTNAKTDIYDRNELRALTRAFDELMS